MGKMYLGIGGQARRAAKAYVGIDGKARRITRGYMGIGGVARPVYRAGYDFTHYGRITGLLTGLSMPVGESLASYAFFAGGGTASTSGANMPSTYTHAYNSAYTRSTPAILSWPAYGSGAARVGSYVVFAGGVSTSNYINTTSSNTVNAYNNSLTRSIPSAMLGTVTNYPAGCAIGNYGVFGPADPGGGSGMSYATYTTMTTYSSTLTRGSFTLLKTIEKLTRAGTYLLCANCYDYDTYAYSSTVEVYNATLTRQTSVNLSSAGFPASTANIGDKYGLFHGTVNDAFNASLARLPLFETLNQNNCAAISTDNHAAFFGGYGTPNGEVVAYNQSLVRSIQGTLVEDRTSTAAARVGNSVFVAGGYMGVPVNTVEVFILPSV